MSKFRLQFWRGFSFWQSIALFLPFWYVSVLAPTFIVCACRPGPQREADRYICMYVRALNDIRDRDRVVSRRALKKRQMVENAGNPKIH